nr:phosphoglycerate kinase, cytosolic [Tanacetum cinerariifolium]
MAIKKSVSMLKESALKGMRVFVRVDLNVPLDDNFKVTNDTRPVWGRDKLVSKAKVIKNQVLVAPEVRKAAVASPAGVLELDTHSSLEDDQSESSLPPVSIAHMVLPFLCSDDSELDTEIPERHVSPTTSIQRSLLLLIYPHHLLLEDILISRLYRTHPGGPCRVLTARKLVRPLLSYRLELRYVSHHLDHFTFGLSLSHSSSNHSSFGHSDSDNSLFEHTPPDTTVADSSTPLRFVYPPLARTLRCSKVYLLWRSAPLSTMYLLTTSESSAGDSSSESSAGPSRKRCRSPAATVISSIHATRALVPSRVDLLPPRKRDVKAGIDACIGMEVDVGIDVEEEVEVEDEIEYSDRGTMEVGLDVVVGIDIPDEIHIQRIEDIKTGHRELKARNMITGRERASLLDQVASLERCNARLRGTM